MRPLALRPGDEPQRPRTISHVSFDDCLGFEYDSAFSRFAHALVPIELVLPGDRQVVVQGRVGTDAPDEPLPIDGLAAEPSVTSIVMDRPIVLRRPLPQVTELFVATWVKPPDSETLGHLPNLESLCLGRSAIEARLDWDVLTAMHRLRDLRIHSWHITTIEPISRLTNLERLRIESQTFESIAPLAACTRLRWLGIGWWKGMHRLGGLTQLEHVELDEGTVSSLRPFVGWRQLRSLTIFGRRLKTFEGVEGHEHLEDLFAYNVAVTDLSPLAALPRLRRIRLDMPTAVTDFSPLGRVANLESLVIHPKGSRMAATPRLADLRGLRSLREIAILGFDGEGWEFLLELPNLERLQLWGPIDPEAAGRLRERFPDAHLDIRSVERRPPSERATVSQLPDGSWSIFEDVTDLVGVDDNFLAEERLRGRLASVAPDLLDRLEFDTEADALGVTGASEADLQRVAAELRQASAWRTP